jgi:uncharacterized delta-60 repeat protein
MNSTVRLKTTLVALCLLTLTGYVGARPHAAGGTPLWERFLNGTGAADSFDIARSVTVDNQGNVIVAGATENTQPFLDFTVAKFDRDGAPLWEQNFHGNGSTETFTNLAFSVAADNRGNVVAAGITHNDGTFDDFTVVKYDRDGTLLWRQNLNGSANGTDEALAVVVDHQADVIAAGQTQNTGTGSGDFTVAKFERQGTLLWQQNLNGTEADSFDAASAVAVDDHGDVVAAGQTQNTGTGFDFTVAKFDRDGILLWQQNLNGTANGADGAFSVTIDNERNVVAAGVTDNIGTGQEFTIAKFDRDGILLWQQTLNGNGGATSVAVDNRGNVVAAGSTQSLTTGSGFTVATFDRNGTLLWRQTLNGGGQAMSVAVDHQGNVVVAGTTENAGTGPDFTVAKFNRDGILIWQQSLNGTGNRDDAAFSVAVDKKGNVVAAGVTLNTGTFVDFTVAKFDR